MASLFLEGQNVSQGIVGREVGITGYKALFIGLDPAHHFRLRIR